MLLGLASDNRKQNGAAIGRQQQSLCSSRPRKCATVQFTDNMPPWIQAAGDLLPMISATASKRAAVWLSKPFPSRAQGILVRQRRELVGVREAFES